MFITASNAVRELHLPVKILFPGLAPCAFTGNIPGVGNVYKDDQFLQEAYAAGVGPAFDALAIHEYNETPGDTTDPTNPANHVCISLDRTKVFSDILAAHGDSAKEMWLTESGYAPQNGVTHDIIASELPLFYSTVDRYGKVGPLCWWIMAGNGQWDNQDMITGGGGRNPEYDAYKGMSKPIPALPAGGTGSSTGGSVGGLSPGDEGKDFYGGNSVTWSNEATQIKFAYIRASEGTTADTGFQSNMQAAKSFNIKRGAYHAFVPGGDPAAQADYFSYVIGGRSYDGELPPMLDVELRDTSVSLNDYRDRLTTFMNRFQADTGITVGIYTAPCLWIGLTSTVPGIENHPLWVAHYGVTEPIVPREWAAAGKKPLLWQYSNVGQDHDRYMPDPVSTNTCPGG
jgi:hypothetical protein